MKLFYNERKHTLIRYNAKQGDKKVAPFSEFEADANEASELMKRYPGKVIEAGSAQHKEIQDKLKKGILRPYVAPPITKDVKETRVL